MADSKPLLSATDPNFLRLSLCYLEDKLSAPELAAFQQQLRTEPARRKIFVRFCLIRAAVIEAASGGIGGAGSGDLHRLPSGTSSELLSATDLSDAMILPAIVEPDEEPSNDQIAKEPAAQSAKKTPPNHRPWLLWRPLWVSAAALVLISVGIAFLLARHHSGPILASGINATWDAPDGGPQPGSALPDAPVELTAGVAHLQFDTGAQVMVEAPALFQPAGHNAISLLSGKLTAVVPTPAHGFTVYCPHASVVDLGTEFGVDVQDDGTARVEVFQGSVRTEPISGSAPAGVAKVLSAGEAAHISFTAVAIDPAGASPQHYILPPSNTLTQLDVTDLVCGGDGTTTRRGQAIDVHTGETGALTQIGDAPGDSVYHRVSKLPVVDGCFVPNGKFGPMQVDSAGDTFTFPATSGVSAQLIWAGGAIPPPPHLLPDGTGRMKTILAATDYAALEHGFLAMHPNKGLTFDLGAIRRLHPDARLNRFHCLVGDSAAGLIHGTSSLFILIDGKRRFESKSINSKSSPVTVDVPIRQTDHFLTLVSLEGPKGIKFCWVLVCDPVITLSRQDTR